ncbi:uncharacterized protein LOC125943600 [Dermacentor silvarum]|uniref:uncharacterized protein LOC125943600 n=1 Tax=Dermacentor silvarum TaxID=543639 RepID=UPI0021013A42|nr:uncharacterized protein LOC125943600 [Dermacentor silvarum]
MAAKNRELTLRAIRERVELLLGYFRRENTANLRRSGFEQYEELQQLLQEVSDLSIRSICKKYPKYPTWPVNTATSLGPSREKEMGRRGSRLGMLHGQPLPNCASSSN